MNLGGEYGYVSPDPTLQKDYSKPLTFWVNYSWEEASYKWTVYVYPYDEDSDSSSAEAFAMTTRATINGKIRSGKTPTVEYRKESETSWSTVPPANVSTSGNTFSATLTGLSASIPYQCRRLGWQRTDVHHRSGYPAGERCNGGMVAGRQAVEPLGGR